MQHFGLKNKVQIAQITLKMPVSDWKYASKAVIKPYSEQRQATSKGLKT